MMAVGTSINHCVEVFGRRCIVELLDCQSVQRSMGLEMCIDHACIRGRQTKQVVVVKYQTTPAF